MKKKTGKRKDKVLPYKKKRKAPFRGLDNSQEIDSILERTKMPHELMGVSYATLKRLYEAAANYYDNHLYDPAKQAFHFLIDLNPYVPDFWLSLGKIYLVEGRNEKALKAFFMTQTLDPDNLEVYGHIIRCCIEAKASHEAEKFLHIAEKKAAHSGLRDKEKMEFFNDLLTFHEEIDELKKR